MVWKISTRHLGAPKFEFRQGAEGSLFILGRASPCPSSSNPGGFARFLVFTHPQGGRVQVPITSGIVSKNAVTFSGQKQFPMGSLEVTFHGTVAGASLTGTAEMTSRSVLIGPQANTASLNLTKQ